MIVADNRRRLNAHRSVKDLDAGDFVRRVAHRGVGIVESISDDGFAWVIWKDERKDYLPLTLLRRVRAGGHKLDSRRWQP